MKIGDKRSGTLKVLSNNRRRIELAERFECFSIELPSCPALDAGPVCGVSFNKRPSNVLVPAAEHSGYKTELSPENGRVNNVSIFRSPESQTLKSISYKSGRHTSLLPPLYFYRLNCGSFSSSYYAGERSKPNATSAVPE
ncbi:MAG TPA: hypothetical protein VLI65_02545 [Pyrinomonadaceae bacterium]|nr:hypothetical protein [Pyrinomonadaceae bacterium]